MTNTETVRAFIDAWNANNIDAIVSFLDDDVFITTFRSNPSVRPQGREQFIRSLGPMDRVDWQLLSIAENGPKVLTSGSTRSADQRPHREPACDGHVRDPRRQDHGVARLFRPRDVREPAAAREPGLMRCVGAIWAGCGTGD